MSGIEGLKGLFLFIVLLISIITCVLLSIREPIVIGTELNGDGSVEYLCLGTGCEDMY